MFLKILFFFDENKTIIGLKSESEAGVNYVMGRDENKTIIGLKFR